MILKIRSTELSKFLIVELIHTTSYNKNGFYVHLYSEGILPLIHDHDAVSDLSVRFSSVEQFFLVCTSDDSNPRGFLQPKMVRKADGYFGVDWYKK